MSEEKKMSVEATENTNEVIEKPKRTRKPKAAVNEAETVQEAVLDNKTVASNGTVTAKKTAKKKTEAPMAETAEPEEVEKKPRRKKTVTEDPLRDTRALLKGNKQTLSILSGTIDCLEFEENMKEPERMICAVTYYEGFRVIIPAGCMGLSVPQDLPAQDRAAMYKKYINAMLASRIEYVIRAVDDKNNLAIGDRNIAMAIRRKQYFVHKRGDKTQMQLAMERKIPVEAHVLAVSGTVVRVEVHGVECRVFAKEASWRYTANLSELFCPGDRVNVIIKSIEQEGDELKVDVSIREATPNRQLVNIVNYKPNSVCTGMITGVTPKGYYIAVGDQRNGIDAFCNLVHGTEIPQVGDKVICQLLKINANEGFATAKITRILQHSKF